MIFFFGGGDFFFFFFTVLVALGGLYFIEHWTMKYRSLKYHVMQPICQSNAKY